MRKIAGQYLPYLITLFLLMSVGVNSGCAQKEEKQKTKKAEITFKETVYDFGKIPYKGDGTHEFEFKNTGKAPLIIQNVKTSCGCTTPSYPRKPIDKKKKETITVKYDTKRQGHFHKTITVYSNGSEQPVVLTIKGEVEKPTKEQLQEIYDSKQYNNTRKDKKKSGDTFLKKEKSITSKPN